MHHIINIYLFPSILFHVHEFPILGKEEIEDNKAIY